MRQRILRFHRRDNELSSYSCIPLESIIERAFIVRMTAANELAPSGLAGKQIGRKRPAVMEDPVGSSNRSALAGGVFVLNDMVGAFPEHLLFVAPKGHRSSARLEMI